MKSSYFLLALLVSAVITFQLVRHNPMELEKHEDQLTLSTQPTQNKLVFKDHKEHKEHKDHHKDKDHIGHKEHKGHKENKDNHKDKDHKEHKEHKDNHKDKDHKEHKEHNGHKDLYMSKAL